MSTATSDLVAWPSAVDVGEVVAATLCGLTFGCLIAWYLVQSFVSPALNVRRNAILWAAGVFSGAGGVGIWAFYDKVGRGAGCGFMIAAAIPVFCTIALFARSHGMIKAWDELKPEFMRSARPATEAGAETATGTPADPEGESEDSEAGNAP